MSQATDIQTKTQLQQLCEFLLANLQPHIKANNIDAFQKDGVLMLDASDLGNGGLRIGSWKHSAEIFIEHFPHRKVNPYNLIALIATFINEAGWLDVRDRLELQDPQLEIDMQSRDSVMLSIELELIDEVDLVPDPQGPIPMNGQRYRVALVPVDVAESADFIPQQPGDKQV